MSDVHECPHCECDECARCGAHIKRDPYVLNYEYFKSKPAYSKSKASPRKEDSRDLCKSCSKELHSRVISFVTEEPDD